MERYVGGEEIDAGLLVRTSRSRSPGARSTPSSRSTRPAASGPESCSTSWCPPSPHRSSTRCRRSSRRRVDRARRSRATRPARWSRRSSRRPPIRTSGGSAWSASSRGPCCRTPPCTCPGTARRGRGRRPGRQSPGPRRGRADRDPLGARWARRSAPPRRWSPATSARSAGSSRAETSDTLSPTSTRRWCWSRGRCRTPSCRWRSEVRTKSDEDKLGPGLQRLAAEDPTLRVEHNAETHQVVLWTMGEAHADVLLDRLAEPLRRGRRRGRAAGAAARDVRPPGHRPRPAREAERRARAVRRVHASRSSRCRRAVGSSSSTGSSAVRCRASSSPRWRRECARRWSAGSRTATRWSTSG